MQSLDETIRETRFFLAPDLVRIQHHQQTIGDMRGLEHLKNLVTLDLDLRLNPGESAGVSHLFRNCHSGDRFRLLLTVRREDMPGSIT